MTDLLSGKAVRLVRRSNEIMIEFDDGARLFVDGSHDGLQFSVTGGCADGDD